MEVSLKAKMILTNSCTEDERLKAFKISGIEWTIAGNLCRLLKNFYSATATESGSYYAALSMTGRIYEMPCDAIGYFEDIEIGTLSSIESSMEDKVSSYVDLANFKLANASCILDPRFKNSSPENRLVLKNRMERYSVIVQPFLTEIYEKRP